jgi:CheY-like chemotaxis protein
LIDDDEDDVEMFSSRLRLKGVEVKTFVSSTNALFYLRLMADTKEFPSLIIMDYSMPIKNGHETLLSIKSNTDTRHIQVVMYSTSMDEPLKGELLRAGALDCFSKPWTYQELTKQVEIIEELTYSFISKKTA